MKFRLLTALLLSATSVSAWADELRLPNIFSDAMVLQRDQANPIWGWADAGSSVRVSVDGKTAEATANDQGYWKTEIPALKTGGPYKVDIKAGDQSVTIQDVLAGEVWLCSGQSNMEWRVASSENFELEKLAANYPEIRMINFPNVGTQEPVLTHENSQWMKATSEEIGEFSAVGYFFGRQLHQTLGVPIGLVNNSWGGSAAEAWVDRKALQENDRFDGLLSRWEKMEQQWEKLQSEVPEAERKNNQQYQNMQRQMTGNQRPGNIYNGVLASHRGYGARGAIWYQGESNAGRAAQYRELFPFMIQNYRDSWGQGDFPFYWVQLADYKAESETPGSSDWAELREAQTMTLDKLSDVGQAVIIDVGEGKDIHPRNKLTVGQRLSRLALRNEYGYDIAADSPRFADMEVDGNKAVLEFKNADKGWRTFDVPEAVGFQIAGQDQKFVNAKGQVRKDGKIEVWSDEVSSPVAVRYGWADNPVTNVYTVDDLPLTPFRTDDWPGVTDGQE